MVHINQGIEYKCQQVKMQLNRTLVRLHLENCIQFWLPQYRMEPLEKVQWRMMLNLGVICYRETLDSLGLFPLEHWKGVLIEVYEVMRSIDS